MNSDAKQSISPKAADLVTKVELKNTHHKELLALSTLFFLFFLTNILLGVASIRFDFDAIHLTDLYEAALLFAAVTTGMIFILLNDES